jgi:hypothetical protein
MKPVNAATDEPTTEYQKLPSQKEKVGRRSTYVPCDRFGDFFRCSAPYDCQENQACLHLWMSRREFEKDSVVSDNS